MEKEVEREDVDYAWDGVQTGHDIQQAHSELNKGRGKKEMHQHKDITRGFVEPTRRLEAA